MLLALVDVLLLFVAISVLFCVIFVVFELKAFLSDDENIPTLIFVKFDQIFEVFVEILLFNEPNLFWNIIS